MRSKMIVVIALVILGLIGRFSFYDKKEVVNMGYSTESLPIMNRFPNLPEFTTCYWKANTIGRTDFGPTNYWMQGLVCLNEKEYRHLLTDYVWNLNDITFPEEIDPSITGKDNFSWHSNAEFQSLILQQNFIGVVLLDINNGILYFSVENL